MLTPDNLDDERLILQRKSLKDEVFDILHQKIVAGSYTPGDWLRQEELATQLGVSHTPVREALDLLVAVGLAERVPYRGVRVLSLSVDEILDVYVMRLLIESAAVRLAAYNATSVQIDALWEILEQTRSLVTLASMSRHRQLNKHLHTAIVSACDNAVLIKQYETISNLFPDWRLYEYMFRHPDLLECSLQREFEEHRAIIAAIAHRDPDQAVANIRRHIVNLGEQLVSFLEIPHQSLKTREAQILAEIGSE